MPRDSDLQRAALGADKDVGAADLTRGDLIFFPGHVGIMADAGQIIHASRRWMQVKAEPLADVTRRIADKGHQPPVSGMKRLR